MNVIMKNEESQLLFLIAQDFLKLNNLQQISIGQKLKILDLNAAFWAPKTVEETVFTMAYKDNKLIDLVRETHKALYDS